MNYKKLFSLVLCLCLMAAALSAVAYAAPADGLCPHHTAHDSAVCEYVEYKAEVPCGHICDVSLGCTAAAAEVPCGHVCSAELGCTAATAEVPCTDVHVHDAMCGYAEAVAAVCTHTGHDGVCGYTEGTPGTPCNHSCDNDEGCQNTGSCTHVHNAECNYTPAVEGSPCGHTCSSESGCTPAAAAQPCTYVHVHDTVCGYAPAKAASCAHTSHDTVCGYAPAKAAVCAHTAHDAACGYSPEVPEVSCTFGLGCPDCNPFYAIFVTVAPAGTYDGTAKTPAVTITLEDTTLVENTDYTLAYSNNVNAGTDTATVTITGIGTYAGQSASRKFSIAPAELTVTIPTNLTKVYGEADPAFTYDVSGIVAPDTVATVLGGNLVRVSGDNAGTYIIRGGTLASINPNYTLTKVENGKLTISPKPITVTAADQSLVYGSAVDQTAATAEGLLDGHALYSVTITPSTTDVTDAGTLTPSKAVISAAIDGKTYNVARNYEITYIDGALTTTAKEVTPTITLTPDRYAYTGAECKPTVKLMDGTTVIPVSEYTVTYSNNINVGTATASVADKEGGNYILKPVSAPFSIVQKVAYSVLVGNGQQYVAGSYLSFVTNGPAANLQSITIDGRPVDKPYYTVSAYTNATMPGVNGSQIAFNPTLMNLVSNGTHTVVFNYSDGVTSATFIKGSASINGVKTGDDSNLGLLCALMCLGLMGSASILPVLRKQKNR